MPRITDNHTDLVRAYFESLPLPDQLNAIAANVEVARVALLEAAKKAHAANLPMEFHRDLLFSMDHMRDLEATVGEYAGADR